MSFKIKQMKYCMLIVMLWWIIFAFLEINTQTDSYGYMHTSPHQSIHSSLYSGIFLFLSALAANQFFLLIQSEFQGKMLNSYKIKMVSYIEYNLFYCTHTFGLHILVSLANSCAILSSELPRQTRLKKVNTNLQPVYHGTNNEKLRVITVRCITILTAFHEIAYTCICLKQIMIEMPPHELK